MTELSADTYWEQDEKFRYTRTGSGTDIAGYVTDVNQGKTRWELCGDAAPLSSSWEEHEAVLAAHQPFRDFEYRRLRPDGTMGYYSASGAPMFDAEGRFQGYQGVARDITERKRVEEALRQSEERYALAVAGSNEGIFDWDLMSDRVYVSYRAQELFGLPRGELWRPRRDWRHIVTFHPDDAPRLHDSIKAHIEGSTPTYDEEFRIVLSGGGVRWFRQRGIALRDASGKAYRVVGSIGDVTEQHKAEEELRSLERRLRLAQRLEAMGTLAGGIAHDFNNILGAILGYGEMALRDARKGSRLARDLDSIIVAGERGRALVDRVLAFSRSAVGERVPVHVEKVVREALDLLSAKLPPDVTLHAKLHAGCAAMLGDATQVHQVLMNLATNAIHAMPVGRDAARFAERCAPPEPRTPTLGIMPAGDYLILQVADSGTGIRRRFSSASSIRSSLPRTWAPARDWVYRSCTASWPSSAVRSMSRARPARAARSPCFCRAPEMPWILLRRKSRSCRAATASACWSWTTRNPWYSLPLARWKSWAMPRSVSPLAPRRSPRSAPTRSASTP